MDPTFDSLSTYINRVCLCRELAPGIVKTGDWVRGDIKRSFPVLRCVKTYFHEENILQICIKTPLQN